MSKLSLLNDLKPTVVIQPRILDICLPLADSSFFNSSAQFRALCGETVPALFSSLLELYECHC